MKSKSKTYALTVLLASTSILVAVGLLEILLRATPFSLVIDTPNESRFYVAEHAERVFDIKPNVTDGSLTFYGNKFSFWSNELGCFDRPYDGTRPFVYLAGDSFTWGYTSFEQKWGTRLEQILGTRVLKCAVSATGTYHQFLKARDILSKYPNPQLIIVGYFATNDVLDDFNFPVFVARNGYRLDNPYPRKIPNEEDYTVIDVRIANHEKYCMFENPMNPIVQRVKCYLDRHSVAYVLTKNGIKRIIPKALAERLGVSKQTASDATVFPDPPEEAYPVHFRAIDSFKKLSIEQHAQLLFVLIPNRQEIYPDVYGTSTVGSTTARVKTYLESQGIAYLDLTPRFVDIAGHRRKMSVGTAGDLYWSREWHLNDIGNLATSIEVAKYLFKTGLAEFNPDAIARLQDMESALYR
jgi:hypothetical protein